MHHNVNKILGMANAAMCEREKDLWLFNNSMTILGSDCQSFDGYGHEHWTIAVSKWHRFSRLVEFW